MKSRGLLFLLIPLALLVVSHVSARQAHEKTAFLERAADALEDTRPISAETQDVIYNNIDSIRSRTLPLDGKLDRRQQRAIDRIQATFLLNGGPYSGPSE